MILTEKEINKISGGSVDYFDRIVFARAIESALLENLRAGVELPEPYATLHHDDGYFTTKQREHDLRYSGPLRTEVVTIEQAIQYGAAQRLAAREQAIEECAKEAERMTMYPGGRQEAPAHDSVWHAARAIRALAASPQEQQP